MYIREKVIALEFELLRKNEFVIYRHTWKTNLIQKQEKKKKEKK